MGRLDTCVWAVQRHGDLARTGGTSHLQISFERGADPTWGLGGWSPPYPKDSNGAPMSTPKEHPQEFLAVDEEEEEKEEEEGDKERKKGKITPRFLSWIRHCFKLYENEPFSSDL